jgi:hypothetical protein
MPTNANRTLLSALIACYLQAGNARVQKPGGAVSRCSGSAATATLSVLPKYDVEVGARQLFWMGMVGCAAACLAQNRGAHPVLHVRSCRHDGEIER